jgi:hypothetical protein
MRSRLGNLSQPGFQLLQAVAATVLAPGPLRALPDFETIHDLVACTGHFSGRQRHQGRLRSLRAGDQFRSAKLCGRIIALEEIPGSEIDSRDGNQYYDRNANHFNLHCRKKMRRNLPRRQSRTSRDDACNGIRLHGLLRRGLLSGRIVHEEISHNFSDGTPTHLPCVSKRVD